MDYVYYLFAAILISVGLIGSVLPMLPGIPLIYIGIIIAAAVSDFSFISPATLIFLLILTIISLIIDYASGAIGARISGSSLKGALAALAGSIIGAALLGPIGIFVGPAAGIFIFEHLSRSPLEKSTKIAKFTLKTTLFGVLANLIIAILMIAIFSFSIFI